MLKTEKGRDTSSFNLAICSNSEVLFEAAPEKEKFNFS